MNIRQPVSQRWQKLSITTKFVVAFGLLLGLIVLVALTGYLALTFVQGQSDSAILVSTEIRGLVLQMDGGLERARRLQRDFFLQYPAVGLPAARQSARLADEQIAQVITYSDELKRLISTTDVSDAWRASDVNLNFLARQNAIESLLTKRSIWQAQKSVCKHAWTKRPLCCKTSCARGVNILWRSIYIAKCGSWKRTIGQRASVL